MTASSRNCQERELAKSMATMAARPFASISVIQINLIIVVVVVLNDSLPDMAATHTYQQG